jgi:hypothetical protein
MQKHLKANKQVNVKVENQGGAILAAGGAPGSNKLSNTKGTKCRICMVCNKVLSTRKLNVAFDEVRDQSRSSRTESSNSTEEFV